MNWKKGMRRVAVVLTVLGILYWIVYGVFIAEVSVNDSNLGFEILTLLIYLILTVGAIWALYGLITYIVKGFKEKKSE